MGIILVAIGRFDVFATARPPFTGVFTGGVRRCADSGAFEVLIEPIGDVVDAAVPAGLGVFDARNRPEASRIQL